METALCFERCQDLIPVFGMIFLFFMTAIALVGIVLAILIYCMVFHKAGYSWALGLLMVVPIANVIMLFILAFGDWPVRRELRLLKQQLKSTEP